MIPRIKLLPYERLFKARVLRAGTYIFSDIERLNLEQAEMAAQVWMNLSNSGKEVRLLNHPTHSMRRYELLRTLYEYGLNKFDIYRLTECRTPQRFPVFLRGENDHFGSLTPLLQTSAELDHAIDEIFKNGQSRENKVITEFCDTSDAKGIFRKYSAFVVGDQIIPCHILFSHDWVVKYPGLIDEATLQEDWQYAQSNPHEAQLREIFQLAQIDYGRIDYGLINEVLQVWEINTNPLLPWAFNENRDDIREIPLIEHFSQQLNSMFKVIDCQADSAVQIPITVKAISKKTNTKQSITSFIVERLPYRYQLTARKKLNALARLLKK